MIATPAEIKKYLTKVLRGETDTGGKDSLKAAELLGKGYGLFSEKPSLPTEADIKITIDYGSD